MNWFKISILENPYGGFPSGGGFNAYMEYEIGAQRIAEAAHCIIGSCSRLHTSGSLIGETEHMQEEIDIIKNCLDEYKKPIYISQYIQPWRLWSDNNFPQLSIESMSSNAQKLLSLSEEKKSDFLEYDNEEIFNIVTNCINLLSILSSNMLESVPLIINIMEQWDTYLNEHIKQYQDKKEGMIDLYHKFNKENALNFYRANKLGNQELKRKALEIDKNIKDFSNSIRTLEFWR